MNEGGVHGLRVPSLRSGPGMTGDENRQNPKFPFAGTLTLSAIKFARRTPSSVALHNVDMIVGDITGALGEPSAFLFRVSQTSYR